jgi:hypothetical protein
MAEQDVNPNEDAVDEEDEENNDAEDQQTLDDLTVLNTEGDGLDEVDQQARPGDFSGGDGDDTGGLGNQVIHTGSQQTDEAILRGLPEPGSTEIETQPIEGGENQTTDAEDETEDDGGQDANQVRETRADLTDGTLQQPAPDEADAPPAAGDEPEPEAEAGGGGGGGGDAPTAAEEAAAPQSAAAPATTQPPTTEAPDSEPPVTEPPVTDAPVTDAPVTDAPVTDAPVTDPPATDPPATDPPATDPPATDPPATDPPATDPPATDPPATDPPATDPPATDPPATDPPATDPPATDPPATDPPATDPPATDPPATDPPATDPPATDPPATDPPATDPPATDPPATDPPATDPPATDPPATDPPATDPPATDPPATDPPATDPPATDPPATDPPATDPPATDPPATDPPATDPPATDPPATDPPVTDPPAEAQDPSLEVDSVSGAEDNSIPLDIDASLNDIDGTETLGLTISDVPDGAIITIVVDGEQIEIQNPDSDTWTLDQVFLDGLGFDGTVADAASTLAITPPQDFYGDFNLSVAATSTETNGDEATTATQTFGVTVTPVADNPLIDAENATGLEDNAVDLDVSVAMEDFNVEQIADIIIGGVPPEARLQNVDGDIFVPNADGTYSFNNADQLEGLVFVPAENQYGDFDLTILATSTDGGTSIGGLTVTVEGVNDAPEANADALNSLTFTADDLLANDTDVDGDTLTITGFDNVFGGEIVDNGDGTFTFTPNEGFEGNASFTYTVSDGEAEATADVVLGVENGQPIAVNDIATVSEDTATVIDVLDNDYDTDGGALTLTDASILDGADGTVTINDDGTLSFDPGDAYNSLAVGETATVKVEYTISDGEGGTATATATLTVEGSNDGPVTSDVTLDATEDAAVSGQLTATDVDGDDLTFSLVDGPAEGTVTVNEDGSFSFDPGSDFQDLGVGETQTVEFTYQVDDGQGGTSTATGTVTVEGTNDGPVAGDVSFDATEDQSITFSADDLLAQASDIDGDDLSISAIADPDNGTLVDNGDGTYTFTPDDNFNGDVAFEFTVSDGEGGTATATATIDVAAVNDGPVAQDESVSATEDGGAVTGQLDATDVDGDDLTFSLVDGPAEGTVTVNEDGSFSFDPGDGFQDLGVGETQTVEFTYEVSDGQGGTSTATGTVTVEGTNDGPVASDESSQRHGRRRRGDGSVGRHGRGRRRPHVLAG